MTTKKIRIVAHSELQKAIASFLTERCAICRLKFSIHLALKNSIASCLKLKWLKSWKQPHLYNPDSLPGLMIVNMRANKWVRNKFNNRSYQSDKSKLQWTKKKKKYLSLISRTRSNRSLSCGQFRIQPKQLIKFNQLKWMDHNRSNRLQKRRNKNRRFVSHSKTSHLMKFQLDSIYQSKRNYQTIWALPYGEVVMNKISQLMVKRQC